MLMSNIRPNFSYMTEEEKRTFFWNYCDSRTKDFEQSELVAVKTKRTKSCSSSTEPKTPKQKFSKEQLELLKALNLI